ncbi:MAG TPA: BamA/TamA family outer membrane protein [Kofleriaceae bacterium]
MRATVLLLAVLAACRTGQYPVRPVPGDTDIGISAVTIEPRAGTTLSVLYKPLYPLLGLRAKSLLYPERGYNDFRLAEDRRRIESYLQGKGRFEAVVDEPRVDFVNRTATVHWTVDEGPQYVVGSVSITGAPRDLEAELRGVLSFGPGDPIDLDPYRLQRLELGLLLQEHGYGHARAYSRTFVDRATKKVAWFFYLDPGPKTTIKTLTTAGNAHVPVDEILERSGLRAGGPFSTADARRAELALLDSGAFVSVNVVSDADIPRLPEYPDSGGKLEPAQIAADGTLVPRTLPSELAVTISVVEAPARQLHVEAGFEADPTRADAYVEAAVALRHLFAPQHHLELEGGVGYGWILGDHRDLADGVYGHALAQYLHPLASVPAVTVRLLARWRDVLYPAFLLREVVGGPGLHATLAPGVSFDGDAWFRRERALDLPMLVADTTDRTTGFELRTSLVADRRDDRVEPTSGWLLGGTAAFAPGGPLGDTRWLQLTADARVLVPLAGQGGAWSLGLRASGGVVLLPGDNGVPFGARLFGGGAYGLRGFGRDRLSPTVACANTTVCDDAEVGGRSLVETSVELRWLPFRKQVGAIGFVDAGNAGAGTNPFADGLALAAGVGGRVRLWYLPIAVDVGYRILDDSQAALAWGRLLAFLRVGEAF